MDKSSDEAEVTYLFAETVLILEEGELAIDEEVTVRSESFDSLFVPNFDAAVRKRDECVRQGKFWS